MKQQFFRISLVFCTSIISITSITYCLQPALDQSAVKRTSSDELKRALDTYAPGLITSAEFPDAPFTLAIGEKRLPCDRSLLEKLYNLLVNTNQYRDQVAQVRRLDTTLPLCTGEQEFLAKRDAHCQQRLEQLLGHPVPRTPRIAICLSGGGYRAAICSAAFLDTFDKIGFLDAAQYISSLSGSTWAVAPWLINQNCPFHNFYGEFLQRLHNNIFQKSAPEQLEDVAHSLSIVTETFLRKLAFDEVPSLIDFYGMLLALSLFSQEERHNFFSIDLSSQIAVCKDGNMPLPLYTANDVHKKLSTVVEFSPFEVSVPDWGIAIPSWSLGRKFNAGVSQNTPPTLTLGYLMGIWGSALSLSCKDLFDFTLDKLEPKVLFEPIKQLLYETVIGDLRVMPARVRNMTCKMDNVPYPKKQLLTVVDQGLTYNLPFLPLVNPSRAIDVIIVLDVSGNVNTGDELRKAEADMRAHCVLFPPIDYTNVATNICSVFDAGPHSKAPVVIYLPLTKNDNYSQSYDPWALLQVGSPLNTLNFIYSSSDITNVCGLIEQSVMESYQTIISTIETVVQRKANQA
jgi:hypothetical protein